MTREHLPTRRASFTQKVRIENQVFYLNMGEYADGRLGEVFLDAQKEGTFTRGILSALARMASTALQNGTPVAEVVKSLRLLSFPPSGAVEGSPMVTHCTSLPDYLAQEIEAYYVPRKEPEQTTVREAPQSEQPVEGKTFGFISPIKEV